MYPHLSPLNEQLRILLGSSTYLCYPPCAWEKTMTSYPKGLLPHTPPFFRLWRDSSEGPVFFSKKSTHGNQLNLIFTNYFPLYSTSQTHWKLPLLTYDWYLYSFSNWKNSDPAPCNQLLSQADIPSVDSSFRTLKTKKAWYQVGKIKGVMKTSRSYYWLQVSNWCFSFSPVIKYPDFMVQIGRYARHNTSKELSKYIQFAEERL
jgi:hypothetical protein